MNKSYGRISENVLFAVLLAAVIGWAATPVVADPLAASSPAGSLAVTTAPHHS
jgi:hypothetical protein